MTTAVMTGFKLQVQSDQLLSALQLVSGVVERRQTLPILGNVLFELKQQTLRLTGTDLEVELQAQLTLDEAATDGSLAVPARKLVDICRSLPDKTLLRLSVEKQNLIIKAGSSRFNLACLPADEFPRAPSLLDAATFALPTSELLSLLTRTHFAMAQQDVRYFLNGCLLSLTDNTITVVATDGHRLAMAKQRLTVDNSVDKKAIIPRKAVLELIRLLQNGPETLNISLDNNHICFSAGEFKMVSKLVDGRFPDYNRVVPRGNNKPMVIDRDVFKQALARVAILANEKHRGVRLDLSENSLVVSANNPEREQAEDRLAVDYHADAISIGFNVSYLLDILNVLPEGNTTWLFASSATSILIENTAADEQDNTYVVMPMRL